MYRLMSNGVEVQPIQYVSEGLVEVEFIKRHYLSFPTGDWHAPLPDRMVLETRRLWIEDWTEEWASEVRKQENADRLEYWWLQ